MSRPVAPRYLIQRRDLKTLNDYAEDVAGSIGEPFPPLPARREPPDGRPYVDEFRTALVERAAA